MSARFIWDRVKEAQVHQYYNMIEVKRGGLLVNIDQTLPEQVILHGLTEAGAPSIGQSYDSDNPHLQCCEIDCSGESSTATGGKINVSVTFNNHLIDGIAWPSDAWYLSDNTTTSLEETQLDSFGNPISVTYWLTSGTKQTDYPKLSKFAPLRTFTIQQLINGRANPSYLSAIATVNDRTWQGYPAGYWLCAAVGATANSRFPQFTEFSVTFISRIKRDWSSYAFFEDETGRVPSNIDPSGVAAVMGTAYDTAQVKATGASDSRNGFVRVGLYDKLNFFSIFGL